jgi:hypothetical protein
MSDESSQEQEVLSEEQESSNVLPTATPFASVRVDMLADSRRLEKIAKVGEQTVFPQDVVRIGEWKDLPSEWPVIPHIVRGPAHFCGPNLVAVRFEDSEGFVYFPIPSVVANLLGAAYEKGSRTALANARKALGLRH